MHTEFTKVIEDVRIESAKFATCIDDLKEGANGYANRVMELETKVAPLSSQVTWLMDKTEDLESRQRTDNCRLIGVEDGFEKIRSTTAGDVGLWPGLHTDA